MTALNFTKVGDEYVSDIITPTGDFTIEIQSAGVLRYKVAQSVSGLMYPFMEERINNLVVRTIVGVVEGTTYQIICDELPTSASYV